MTSWKEPLDFSSHTYSIEINVNPPRRPLTNLLRSSLDWWWPLEPSGSIWLQVSDGVANSTRWMHAKTCVTILTEKLRNASLVSVISSPYQKQTSQTIANHSPFRTGLAIGCFLPVRGCCRGEGAPYLIKIFLSLPSTWSQTLTSLFSTTSLFHRYTTPFDTPCVRPSGLIPVVLSSSKPAIIPCTTSSGRKSYAWFGPIVA